ncbi:MAG: hypothetical protein IPP13_02240 [Kouleothrix sp.]|jgi:hypothetical protein|nr:hypothetical protein [Kouleothrix sp.]
MKVFMGFIMLCFVGATLLRGRTLRFNIWMLLGVIVLVSMVYFFFNQL